MSNGQYAVSFRNVNGDSEISGNIINTGFAGGIEVFEGSGIEVAGNEITGQNGSYEDVGILLNETTGASVVENTA